MAVSCGTESLLAATATVTETEMASPLSGTNTPTQQTCRRQVETDVETDQSNVTNYPDSETLQPQRSHIPSQDYPMMTRRQRRRQQFLNKHHSLRINVSELAACAGFHPYKSLPKLLLGHVYQGSDGQALLREDTELLGLQLISEEEQWKDLAQKAGKETLQALQKAIQVQTGKERLHSIQQAEQLKKTVIEAAQKSKQLSTKEIKVLQEGARHSIYTGCGTAWEDQALDMYEKQCGWPVQYRNSEVRIWEFQQDGIPLGPARSRRTPTMDSRNVEATDTVSKRRKLVPNGGDDDDPEEGPVLEVIDLDLTDGMLDHGISNSNNHQLPFFTLCGAVDGIRDEIVTTDKSVPTEQGNEFDDIDDDVSWTFRPIIVECKHRMHQIKSTPHLYEMIQTTAYCFMYETQAADIIQVLRQDNRTKQGTIIPSTKSDENEKITNYFPAISSDVVQVTDSSALPQSESNEATRHYLKEEDESQPSIRISVTRLMLDDPILGHRQNWNSIVLPRLLAWTKGVYTVRSQDDLRYRLLLALSTEDLENAWNIVYEQLDWLCDCDTSYHRDVATATSS